MDRYEIRAIYNEQSIRVYQAFSPEIAFPAIKAGKFAPPFKMTRMTWIKPSFNWMMYRSGYATRSNQEIILGIDITRDGFEWAINNAVLSNFQANLYESREHWKAELARKPVRLQWDPERDWDLQPIDGVRTIQIGLGGEAVFRYIHEWTMAIEDVTPWAEIAREAQRIEVKPNLLPSDQERRYPLSF
jgi:hypothetical protein